MEYLKTIERILLGWKLCDLSQTDISVETAVASRLFKTFSTELHYRIHKRPALDIVLSEIKYPYGVTCLVTNFRVPKLNTCLVTNFRVPKLKNMPSY
jgi:hypothetical protein